VTETDSARDKERAMTERTVPEPPQFPVGPFAVADESRDRHRDAWIEEIERTPARVREAVAGLTERQLETKYRNWTIRQIAHHIADSHLNSYVRFKLALTEDQPAIKPYDEGRWSSLADARGADPTPSLRLLEGLHERWGYLLRSLGPGDFERAFYHPESRDVVPLWRALAYYVWHAHHHTGQIEWVKIHRLALRG
jgi:uncharacterized damage-inducible protein DinB